MKIDELGRIKISPAPTTPTWHMHIFKVAQTMAKLIGEIDADANNKANWKKETDKKAFLDKLRQAVGKAGPVRKKVKEFEDAADQPTQRHRAKAALKSLDGYLKSLDAIASNVPSALPRGAPRYFAGFASSARACRVAVAEADQDPNLSAKQFNEDDFFTKISAVTKKVRMIDAKAAAVKSQKEKFLNKNKAMEKQTKGRKWNKLTDDEKKYVQAQGELAIAKVTLKLARDLYPLNVMGRLGYIQDNNSVAARRNAISVLKPAIKTYVKMHGADKNLMSSPLGASAKEYLNLMQALSKAVDREIRLMGW